MTEEEALRDLRRLRKAARKLDGPSVKRILALYAAQLRSNGLREQSKYWCSVELIGIEPTASRVRWHGDGPAPKDFAALDRQETSANVPERPILAACSQNSGPDDPVSAQLEDARREWRAERDVRRLRKALPEIMGLLDD